MMISYAKGARTWERHVDIIRATNDPYQNIAHYHTRQMSGLKLFTNPEKCVEELKIQEELLLKKTKYLDALVRGVYFKKDLPEGHVITTDDVYLAIASRRTNLPKRVYGRRGAAQSL